MERKAKREKSCEPMVYLKQMDITHLTSGKTKLDRKSNTPKSLSSAESEHHKVNTNSKTNLSPLATPKANEFTQELKQVLHERNLLTTRTKKRVFDVLEEIEVTNKAEGIKRKKENAIFEIIVSEKSYVKQLSIIVNFFMKPIREKKLLNSADYELLFGNIQTIYLVNETLLKELYKGSLNVANAFLKIAPYFKMYSSYAMRFKNTLDVLQKARIKNSEFCKFVEMQESRPEVQNKLSALLIAPIQRIPRYKLLLQQLFELTSPSDSDYQSIVDSLAKVEQAAEHINQVVEDQENIQRLLEVQRCLRNSEPSIITPGRVLLKEGILLQFDKNTRPSEKFYVILLSDIILFCKMKATTIKPDSLKCKKIFPLNKCSIIENPEKGCFQVHCQGEDIVLYDRIVSVTKDWVKSIREAIENYLEKRKTLKKENSARRPVKRKDINEYNDVGLSPGVPLKRRRQTIEEEIRESHYLLSPRRSIRSMTPSLQKRTELPLIFQRHSESRILPEHYSSSDKETDTSGGSTPHTEVYVFGKDNPNTSFRFRLSNMISSFGSSVFNMFKFRR